MTTLRLLETLVSLSLQVTAIIAATAFLRTVFAEAIADATNCGQAAFSSFCLSRSGTSAFHTFDCCQ